MRPQLGFHPCIFLIWVVSMLNAQGKKIIRIRQKEEAQTIHKYQTNLRVHRKNSKQSQNYTLSETEWIRMHQKDKKLVINILNAQSQREKDQSKNILTQFYLIPSGQDPILCCTTTKAYPCQTCATTQGNVNLLSVKNYLKISKIIY